MSDKFLSTLANDNFAPRLPSGSRLIFQKDRKAKPGDIVAVTYTDDPNDFCIEPYREGVAYFAVAIRAALPKATEEMPSDEGNGAALDSLVEVDFDDDINTAETELISAVSEVLKKTGDALLEIQSLKTLAVAMPGSLRY